jgi:hypothetical protein
LCLQRLLTTYLEGADAETHTDDLLHCDFWPRQTDALEPLIALVVEVLLEVEEQEASEREDGEEEGVPALRSQ